MGFDEANGDTPVIGGWQSLAEQVAAILRDTGIYVFQTAVRKVAREHLNIGDERERREQARCETLKKTGVLYLDETIPKRPGADWFFHLETLRGSIILPPEIPLPPTQPKPPSSPACLQNHKPREDWYQSDKDEVDAYRRENTQYEESIRAFWPEWQRAILPIFEHTKQRMFPTDEEGGFEYEFQVCAWLPPDLDPTRDPPNECLLPIPKRKLTDNEKITVLAAVYDAHWRGSEKVAPWGVSESGEGPEAWPSELEWNERRAALGYYLLVCEAEKLGTGDLPIVRSWLEDVPLKRSTILEALGRIEADATSRGHPQTKMKTGFLGEDSLPLCHPNVNEPAVAKGFLGGASLTDALGIHPTRREAFFRKLERLRLNLDDDSWQEVHEPRPNSPRFLFRVDSSKIREVAEAYKKPKLA